MPRQRSTALGEKNGLRILRQSRCSMPSVSIGGSFVGLGTIVQPAPPSSVTFPTEIVEPETDGALPQFELTYPSVEAREKNVREYHAIEGGKQTMERLAEHLSARLLANTQGGVQ